jgi:ribosome maturation factor RimP
MTSDDLTKKWVNQTVRVSITVGSQVWHYQGKVISVDNTHITLDDMKEGKVSVPLATAMIREVK